MLSEATKEFIQQHRFDDVNLLALSAKNKTKEDVDLPLAIIQIAGRQTVEKKIPSWFENNEIMYPSHLSLEQCSSEETAKYKASLVSGKSFVDLTGGFGVDSAFISVNFNSAIYVEKKEELCKIAKHNFHSLRLPHIEVRNSDASDFLKNMLPVDCIYLDPARRSSSGKKIVAISDCEPDLTELKPLLFEKVDSILVKLSPMLDISLALKSLPETSEIHVVSVDNECKELLFLMRKNNVESPLLICVDLKKDGSIHKYSFKPSEEKEVKIKYTSSLKKYLYEPNTSILKAGAYRSIAATYNIEKLHIDSHLYTSDNYLQEFPGRIFEIEHLSTFNKKNLKSTLNIVEKANLSIRNFPMSTEELRKKIKIKDGGDYYLFATTLCDEKKALIVCKKCNTPK